MLPKDYDETIDWLFQQFPSYQNIGARAYKPSLENVERLIDQLAISLTTTPYVHVAGTNGKGSTCSMIASVLTEAGYKVGLFTSPHIKDFRERIRINGCMISEHSVVEFVQRIKSIELEISPSFFELTFALAIEYFNKEKCDIAIIETGLGGRLDATNIIHPILTVITNISLEHQNFLGDTREAIAGEKGGIIKPMTPVVFGQFDEEIAPVFSTIVKRCNATFYRAESKQVDYLERNKELAKKSLKVLNGLGFSTNPTDFKRGMLNLKHNTGLQGRLQIISNDPLTIIDAAHNSAGIKLLMEVIFDKYPSSEVKVVYGASSDKDLNEIGKLFPINIQYFLTKFKNERSLNMDQLISFSNSFKLNATFFEEPKEALKSAQKSADDSSVVLVFGSFFLLEDIF